MIKNSGLGLLAEVAADEDYYPVRRRGQKRRLNPNRAAIEWLENDTLDLTEERGQFLMSDKGGRYALDDTRDFVKEECVLVTKARGSILGTHHSRPMFECFEITENKGTMSYPDPCPDCHNFAYSTRECGRHAEAPAVSSYVSELNRITAPSVRVHVDGSLVAQELCARMTGVNGSEINLSWRVNPS